MTPGLVLVAEVLAMLAGLAVVAGIALLEEHRGCGSRTGDLT